MHDIKRLDEDVLNGLIRGLRIPAPSLTNPSAAKEILFPANLISLVTNEMWKYGLIPESERFLANVMQAIQAHVMVSDFDCWSSASCITLEASRSQAKIPSYMALSGFRMFTKCCPLSA
jgi:myosin-5